MLAPLQFPCVCYLSFEARQPPLLQASVQRYRNCKASYAFDFSWKWIGTLNWWLNECSVFSKLSLKVKFPVGQRVTGRPEHGGAGPLWALPAMFTGFPLAICCSTPIQYWAVPIPKEEMPFSSMALFAEYPSILLFVSKSQFLQQRRTGRSQGEIRWRLRRPQIQPLTETKKSSNTFSASGLQQGDTNCHNPGFHYFS